VPVPTPTTTELTSPTTSAVAVAPSAKPTHAPAPAPVPKPDAAPAPAPAPKPATNNTEAARAALLKGDTAAVKRLLGPSVNGGHATQDEVTMLKAACKASGDRACVDDIKAKYPSW
jgi:outer membrane biosynthesis protein TonB